MTRGLPRLARIIVSIILFTAGATAFYSVSSASSLPGFFKGRQPAPATISKPETKTEWVSSKSNKSPGNALLDQVNRELSLGGANIFSMLAVQAGGGESVATFAADCTTPKSSFALGETVCVKATNTPVGLSVLRRFSWSARTLATVRSVNITSPTQTDTFTLPTTLDPNIHFETRDVDARGVWRINTVDADGAIRTSASFTVTDPAAPSTDMEVTQWANQASGGAAPDSSIDYNFQITNNGPDTAQSVSFTNNSPPNTTFDSVVQNGGFNCTTANGATTCTAASLPIGGTAIIRIRHHVNAGVSSGEIISDTASVASSTGELDISNNTSVYDLVVGSDTPVVETCDLTCPGDITSPVTGIKIQLDADGDPVLDANGHTIPILDGNGNQIKGAIVTFNVEADGASCSPITCTSPSGSFFPVGTTPVTCTAPTGDSCSFDVRVAGITITPNGANPLTICPTNSFTDPGATAQTLAGQSLPVTATGNVNSTTPGTYSITYSTTDGTSTVTATRTVIINDSNEPPTITLIGDESVTVECHTSYTDPGATATSACAGSIPAVPSGSVDVNTPGTYTITYTATDGVRVTTATRTVDVVDTIAPVPSVDPLPNATGECSVTLTAPTASDSCAGPITATTSDPTSYTSQGTYLVNWTYTDASGNTTTQTQTVIVKDVSGPSLTVPQPSEASANASCQGAIPDIVAQSSSTDNCGGQVTLTQSPAAGTMVGLGPHTITVTATDAVGNMSSAQTVFTVKDTTAPVISCPSNIDVWLPLNSTATSMPVSFTVTATDSCDTSVTVTTSVASGSAFGVGPTVVNATATDDAGNTSNCSFTVTVHYNFTGFFSPIGNLPVLNQVNAGRAIPVKFSLSGNKGLNILAPDYPASGVMACSSSDPVQDVTNTVEAGNSSLSYDPSSDQYHYVWKTSSSWAGTCRQLVVKLNDGSVYRANFKFK